MASYTPLKPPPPAAGPNGSSAAHDDNDPSFDRRMSNESELSVSTTSFIFERIGERAAAVESASMAASATGRGDRLSDFDDDDPIKVEDMGGEYDLETGPFLGSRQAVTQDSGPYVGDGNASASSLDAGGGGIGRMLRNGGGNYTKMDRGLRQTIVIVSFVVVGLWVAGLFIFITNQAYLHGSAFDHDPMATATRGSLHKITRDQLANGFWRPKRASIQWVAGPNGEDGLLLETSRAADKVFLSVEDVRSLGAEQKSSTTTTTQTLVVSSKVQYGGKSYDIVTTSVSPDMRKVLLVVDRKANWRHSKVSTYFVLDVATQTVQPLVPGEPEARVQLAQWSPLSDAVSFTRANNLYLRKVSSGDNDGDGDGDGKDDASVVQAITTDGGPELFYGVPDWVYEEEVFGGPSATWWSPDGRYMAFLRTNETGVPSYPIQYFIERPSETEPAPGEENYPEVREIKYPKAGAHNPVVRLQFYDVESGDVFSVPVLGEFADDDRLITTVLWAGPHKVLIKETNRVSDVMRVVVVDVAARSGTAVRTVDVGKIDGGWFEISQLTRYIPRDVARGRPDDGYIDTVVYNNGDHLAYFTPPENPEPVMLTTGPDWEVVDAPSAVDLERNLVYFLATIEGSTQRHLYSVRLQDGSGREVLTNTSAPGFYAASFSVGPGAGYVLLEYRGPDIPWQRLIRTPAAAAEAATAGVAPFDHAVEDNAALAERARKHSLPLLQYGTLEVAEGVNVNYVERRPPHFDASKQYPVLFQQYSGPGSQEVKHEFKVDFQAYVAASLGYVVVTVDSRGTGFLGRKHRVVVRGQLGVVESHDQIAAAQHWAGLPYVDSARLAIWGWSFGGFMALKTLEQDGGRTFRYGIAVAPVIDWRYYDSIYTERYMDTPQENAAGYDASAVRNVSALAANERFLVMHGVADDNVHMQNTLTLLDRLDLGGISNYDVHVFPDSDHGIFFHNGNQIVYDKLENWLINAFNGEWIKVGHAQPAARVAGV